ncbi:GH3 family acyl-acid amido synthetase [Paraburkholderia megapolitana]|uniref:GH3 family domain-containing protein n=1 Tax=Paraburkholderia megapolitana TaxID=420953 RepID=UPI0038B9B2A7
MNPPVSGTHDAWRTFADAAAPTLAAWQRMLDDPAATQRQRLAQILDTNRDTAFGRAHGFAQIADAAQYRERVPVHSYADLEPWIERAQRDTQPVLTAQPPLFFERTSGNSAQQKRIPYTAAFLGELQHALTIWLADLYRRVPEIGEGRAYWSMSPPLQAPGRAPNGIPIGSESDFAYLDGSIVAGLAATLIVPRLASDAGDDTSAWRRQTLLALIEAADLAFISVWSPTFLTSLLRPLFDADDPTHRDTLAWLEAALPAPRRAALRHALEAGSCDALWPRLAAVSCWMDGPSRDYAATLQARFPQARWLPKSLFATEAIVSVPFGDDEGCPLAVAGHYFECIFDDGTVRETHELAPGDIVQIVVTTGGGLYRYALGDRVRVVGMTDRTPRIEFVGRVGAHSDLVGEKLDEAGVAAVLAACVAAGDSACLVPCAAADPPHYVLLVASEVPCDRDALSVAVESGLARSFHYAHARRFAQLGPVRVRHLAGSPARLADLLQQAAEQTGIRAGDVKPRALVNRLVTADALLALTQR